MENFKALGLSENVLAVIQQKGWETPSPIQQKTIPLLLQDEKDVVGQAATGTGKTGAFGLPLIDKLDDTSKKVQALILCPTRELAVQVAEEISSFKGTKNLWVQAIYGGASYSTQEKALRKGVQIVVGTPGRIRDHIARKTLKLDSVTHVVLDEADEMLNMGFEEEVREILKQVPEKRRMLLFSATMPSPILKIAKTFMGEYELIAVQKEKVATELTDQIFFEVRDGDRFEALCRIIDTEPEFYGIVFCRTKNETDIVADKLIDRGYDAEAIHGDVTQNQRELTLKKFKLRKVVILVATDVAARGIDVNDLTHVVNYNLPQDPEAYVHRIGRTGRAGKQGTAITIVAPSEMRDLMFIQRIAGSKIRKEAVPGIEDVVATKKMKLKTDLLQLMDQQNAGDYISLANELLAEGREAPNVLAALLSYTLKNSLKEASYRDIREVSGNKADHEKARLFVAKGHTSNMTGDKIAEFVATESGIDVNVIHDIRVYDNFSFITLPFAESELVLAVFNKLKKGGRSLVTKAKEKEGGGGGGGGRRNDSGPRREFKPAKPFSERRSFDGEKKSFGEKKQFSQKPEFKKSFDKNESSSEGKPKRRENKLVDYLEKKPAATKNPAAPKKKGEGEVEKFLKNYEEDLSW